MTSTAARESADPGVARTDRRSAGGPVARAQPAPSLGRRRGRWGCSPLLVVTGGGLRLVARRRPAARVHTVQDKADVAQKQLEPFREALKAGDRARPRATPASGRAGAVARPRRPRAGPQVRVAKWLPYTREHGRRPRPPAQPQPGHDRLGRRRAHALLRASPATTRSSSRTARSTSTRWSAAATRCADMRGGPGRRPRSELHAVDGDGPLGDEALEKKRTGLKQIRSLRAEIKPFAPVVRRCRRPRRRRHEALPGRGDEPGRDARRPAARPLSVALVVLEERQADRSR